MKSLQGKTETAREDVGAQRQTKLRMLRNPEGIFGRALKKHNLGICN